MLKILMLKILMLKILMLKILMLKIFFTGICILLVNISIAQQIPTSPETYTPVNDYAQVLNTNDALGLSNKLKTYFDSTTNQVVIVTVQNLGGISEIEFAQKLFQDWGIGQKAQDNGVLILVAKQERKIRIHCGYGAEKLLPDTYCAQLIDELITPNFKAGNFFKGLDKASTAIIDRLGGGKGEFSEQQPSEPTSVDVSDTELLLFFLFSLLPLLTMVLCIRYFGSILEERKKDILFKYPNAKFAELNFGRYVFAGVLTFIILIFTAGIPSIIIFVIIMESNPNLQLSVFPLLYSFFTALSLYLFRYNIQNWLLDFEPTTSKSSTYSSTASRTYTYSSYSDTSTSTYSDYSDSYSDSFGGGSSGGGGASGSW